DPGTREHCHPWARLSPEGNDGDGIRLGPLAGLEVIGYDTDHGRPVRRARVLEESHAPPYRVLVGPQPARHRLVDDGDARTGDVVGRVQDAPAARHELQCLEVSVAGEQEVGGFAMLRVYRLAFDLVGEREVAAAEGAGGYRGGLHSGDGS